MCNYNFILSPVLELYCLENRLEAEELKCVRKKCELAEKRKKKEEEKKKKEERRRKLEERLAAEEVRAKLYRSNGRWYHKNVLPGIFLSY